MDAPRSPLVLVVDDDWRTARVLVKMLREDGFDAEVATDGARAIGRLSRSPRPDALVTDLWLSHADGAAVAQFARSLSPHLTVVVVADDRLRAAALAERLGPPARVLSKPIDYEVLRAELGAKIAATSSS